ncbi:MAG: trans-aconitate 2-methyltransferase [Burkholderiaceae bacterium]|jgi:trans-aconitate 2-methyltransferase
MNWSAQQYLVFEEERTRPVRDLLESIPAAEVRRAVDIGCGPGNSTEALMNRYPLARVTGMDSSEDMVQTARKRLPQLEFGLVDVRDWDEAGPFDVIFANAVFQWVPDHASLFPRLVAKLSPGGSLAIQMPDNLEEPSHVLMREVAQDASWSDRIAHLGRASAKGAAWYYELLKPHCVRVDIWRTTYHHPLASGAQGVVEWFKGSALRPLLARLQEKEKDRFLQRYTEAIEKAYPALADGTVLLPFPRLFIVATR